MSDTIGKYDQNYTKWKSIDNNVDYYRQAVEAMDKKTLDTELYNFLDSSEYYQFIAYLGEERQGGAVINSTELMRMYIEKYFGVDTFYAFIEFLETEGYIE